MDNPPQNPSELSQSLLELSAEYGKLTDELIIILEKKPALWMELRRSTQSDTSAERAWSATVDGMKETTIRLKIKALEKSMSAIKARLRVQEVEAKNQW